VSVFVCTYVCKYVCIAYVCRYRGTLSAAWEMIWKASRFSFGSVRYAVYWRLTAPLRSSCIDSALPTHSWASVMLFPITILPSIAMSTSPLCTLYHGARITSTDPHTCTQHAHHITCICPPARSSAAIYFLQPEASPKAGEHATGDRCGRCCRQGPALRKEMHTVPGSLPVARHAAGLRGDGAVKNATDLDQPTMC
jgi:hypothetical protein